MLVWCLKSYTYNYRISNNPKDTLLNALCLWNTNNALLLEDKKNIILKFLDDDSVCMSLFSLDLLAKNNYSRSVRLEEFRSYVRNDNILTYDWIFSVVNIVTSKIANIIVATKSTEVLCAFIKSYRLVKLDTYEDLGKGLIVVILIQTNCRKFILMFYYKLSGVKLCTAMKKMIYIKSI